MRMRRGGLVRARRHDGRRGRDGGRRAPPPNSRSTRGSRLSPNSRRNSEQMQQQQAYQQQQLEAMQQQQYAPPPPPAPASAGRWCRFDGAVAAVGAIAHRRRVLSDEEFAAAKQKLLGG